MLRPKFDRYASAAQRQVFLDGIVPHLTQMHPWHGIPILPLAAFLVGARSWYHGVPFYAAYLRYWVQAPVE